MPRDELEKYKEEAEQLKSMNINTVDMQWVQVLAEGWASPLNGFMKERQYLQALHFNCFQDCDNINQSIPIVLALDQDDKERLETQDSFTLRYKGKAVAIMRNPEFFLHRKEERCCRQFATSSRNHPHVKMIYEAGDYLVGGKIDVLGMMS